MGGPPACLSSTAMVYAACERRGDGGWRGGGGGGGGAAGAAAELWEVRVAGQAEDYQADLVDCLTRGVLRGLTWRRTANTKALRLLSHLEKRASFDKFLLRDFAHAEELLASYARDSAPAPTAAQKSQMTEARDSPLFPTPLPLHTRPRVPRASFPRRARAVAAARRS